MRFEDLLFITQAHVNIGDVAAPECFLSDDCPVMPQVKLLNVVASDISAFALYSLFNKLPYLERLHIGNAHNLINPNTQPFMPLSRIKIISITHSDIHCSNLLALLLAAAENLEALNISNCKNLSGMDFSTLPVMPAVRKIQLRATDLSGAAISELLSKTPNLRELQIFDCAGMVAFDPSNIVELPYLEEIDIHESALPGATFAALLNKAKNIKIIHFHERDTSFDSADLIEQQTLNKLEMLYFYGAADSIEMLSAFLHKAPNLIALCCYLSNIDLDAQRMQKIPVLKSLQTLVLMGNNAYSLPILHKTPAIKLLHVYDQNVLKDDLLTNPLQLDSLTRMEIISHGQVEPRVFLALLKASSVLKGVRIHRQPYGVQADSEVNFNNCRDIVFPKLPVLAEFLAVNVFTGPALAEIIKAAPLLRANNDLLLECACKLDPRDPDYAEFWMSLFKKSARGEIKLDEEKITTALIKQENPQVLIDLLRELDEPTREVILRQTAVFNHLAKRNIFVPGPNSPSADSAGSGQELQKIPTPVKIQPVIFNKMLGFVGSAALPLTDESAESLTDADSPDSVPNKRYRQN